MTKKNFIRAAEIVNNIRLGHWTNQPPQWSLEDHDASYISPYSRAVQTAEAFIFLFADYNPHFDSKRFLIACGLVDAPIKAKRKAKVV